MFYEIYRILTLLLYVRLVILHVSVDQLFYYITVMQ